MTTTKTRDRLCPGCGNCWIPPDMPECTYCRRITRAKAFGWTLVSDANCPRTLTGKRSHNRWEYAHGWCWCDSGANDHGATWRDRGGNRFVLWEPYHARSGDLARLAAAAHRDGLQFDICESVWNPPHTIGIRFTACIPVITP
jgi:hypothetical protein